MSALTVEPAPGGLRGRIRVPGDKSVSHRALLMAARAEGRSTLAGLSDGLDVRCTPRAIAQFGASVEPIDGGVAVVGGLLRLHEAESVVDVGNSGTGIRLLAGWAATLDCWTILTGDESVNSRPMERVATPLRMMGATVDGRAGGRLPPLAVRGGSLTGIDYRLPVPSAQVKGSVLLAGLGARGTTTVREDLPTRTHTEEMLRIFGADVDIQPGAVTVVPGPLRPVDLTVPGDPSQAAFWVVAACITPGSDVTVEGVYTGPSRAGFVDVLKRMGADIELVAQDADSKTASIRARYAPLRATDIGGSEVPGLIDEIPVLAVAAAFADGLTTFSDAAELRVKETDRVETTVAMLRALGADSDGRPDGIVVEGRSGAPFSGGQIDSRGDHRIAMSAAVAALSSSSSVTIDPWEAVATSYPGFEQELLRCAS